MVVNIIKLANDLDIKDENEIEVLFDVLEDRKNSIKFMEPVLYGSYNKWSERLDDIEDICELCKRLKEETSLRKRKKLYEELLTSLAYHQIIYGGLKKFRY